MPRYFFDTSALVKNDHVEVGTADVQRILAEADSEFLISRLATVEMLSGFAGKVRTGAFSSTDFGLLRRRFLADVRKRPLRPVRVLNAHYQAAGDLIGKHAMSRQLRTLDAIHPFEGGRTCPQVLALQRLNPSIAGHSSRDCK